MDRISLSTQSMFSDLEQRIHDADFAENFDPAGSFHKRRRGNRFYWYWQRRQGSKVIQKYVGPYTDKEITNRVKRHEELKSDYDQRREIVRALTSAGLPRTDVMSGEIVEAMWRAGFFRLRGVLVGTTAFQCYAGVLGVRLPNPTTATQDADFAQYFAIANMIDDAMPPILEVLREVDDTFRAIPHASGAPQATAFVNKSKYRVEFLTPNRGSNDYEGQPARMPALGGAAADPMRFLDYLIREPIRSVLLHGAGVPVTIPAPERYAIQKLIVSERRRQNVASKVNKDVAQAAAIIEAMWHSHYVDLSGAWEEAWGRGKGWRTELITGMSRLGDDVIAKLGQAIRKGAGRRRKSFEDFWPEQFSLDLE